MPRAHGVYIPRDELDYWKKRGWKIADDLSDFKITSEILMAPPARRDWLRVSSPSKWADPKP